MLMVGFAILGGIVYCIASAHGRASGLQERLSRRKVCLALIAATASAGDPGRDAVDWPADGLGYGDDRVLFLAGCLYQPYVRGPLRRGWARPEDSSILGTHYIGKLSCIIYANGSCTNPAANPGGNNAAFASPPAMPMPGALGSEKRACRQHRCRRRGHCSAADQRG
jgi:hypothetical protein